MVDYSDCTDVVIEAEIMVDLYDHEHVYIYIWDAENYRLNLSKIKHTIFWGQPYSDNDCPTWVRSLFYWMSEGRSLYNDISTWEV